MSKEGRTRSGFTLAELLIVVAIIAVLVSISIPIFSTQLEKSREAVDLANLRNAYAECSAAVLSKSDTGACVYDATKDQASASVKIAQKTMGWLTSDVSIGTQKVVTTTVLPGKETVVTVLSDGTLLMSVKKGD